MKLVPFAYEEPIADCYSYKMKTCCFCSFRFMSRSRFTDAKAGKINNEMCYLQVLVLIVKSTSLLQISYYHSVL